MALLKANGKMADGTIIGNINETRKYILPIFMLEQANDKAVRRKRSAA